MSNTFKLPCGSIVTNNQTTYGTLENLYTIDLEKGLVCAKHFLEDMKITWSIEAVNMEFNFDIIPIYQVDAMDYFHSITKQPFVKPLDLLLLLTLSKDKYYIKRTRDFICSTLIPFINKNKIKHDDFKKEAIMSTTPTTNQLINIQKSDFNGQLIETVNLRELHEFLGSKQDFSTWIKNRIEKYGFEENQDYIKIPKILKTPTPQKNGSGQNSNLRTTVIEYYGTIDMAKELCMVENNEKGRTMRKHFIERDKQLTKIEQQPLAIPQSLPEALRLAAVLAEEKEQLQLERDVAIKTKAQIGSKREASIMGKLSQANAKIRQLESQGTLDLKGEKLSLMQIANKLNVSPNAIAVIVADLGITGLPSLGEVRYMKNNGKTTQDWFYNPVAVGLIKQTLEGRSKLS